MRPAHTRCVITALLATVLGALSLTAAAQTASADDILGATSTDGDMTGDGHADLVVVGAQAGLPSGLWLAQGLAGDQIDTAATDIGAQGTGVGSVGSPADWNGTQAVTGHFHTGSGFNDVLDYDPATGVGTILYGNGTSAALPTTSGNEVNVPSPVFQESLSGQTATSVANGGSLYNTVNGNPVTGFPDLLLVLGGNLLDEAAMPTPGAFTGADAALPLSGTNPAGTGDWTGWTLTSTLTGGLPALFARDTTGGSLYYYSPADLENLAMGGAANPLQLAPNGWSATTAPVVQAADINGDGAPDLWSVNADGTVTAYLLDGTTLTAQNQQQLTPAAQTSPCTGVGTGGHHNGHRIPHHKPPAQS
ncbi:hypothetical protein [Streptomyces sp. NBC_01190]|uniref:hypothetical protein n=1 Tax=Streptomyces sp. NBC_01190 TaxID=2903767 RepID=UPI00386B5FED|nr:hypothetical protein OG519_33640 [Streptomyces sp. NBC_01190]